MNKIYYLVLLLFAMSGSLHAQGEGKTVTIQTNVGTMKARLYDDVPNHVRTFINRARQGEFNGTLFTRVIKEFMIQGGAPDSKTAPPGARCGFGDSSAEILPELNSKYFHKKEPWLLPAKTMTSIHKRNRICRNSLSCREKYTATENWIRWN